MSLPPRLHLGIDTGGTYTDGVLLDAVSGQLVKKAKALTTHYDLRVCIEQVVDEILADCSGGIELVSLSTTLATNAIAEGKQKPVALFLIGYDQELVERFHFERRLGTPHITYIEGKNSLEGLEEVPLNESQIVAAAKDAEKTVAAIAISAYASPMNSSHEQRAAQIAADVCHLPIVQAHALSNDLDSIRRAATATLNASLLATVQDFLAAVTEMLRRHKIDCVELVVRGDGSVVKAAFASQRPVEIIHSGPATSAIGAHSLAACDTGLVIDIGGTTTDIALVENGRVLRSLEPAYVGEFPTCIKTIRARSFGLGGDSRIAYDRWKNLLIGPQRVIPLTYLAFRYPQARAQLLEYIDEVGEIRYSDRLEFWGLRREPAQPFADPRTNQAIALLRNGPMRVATLIKEVGVISPFLIDGDELIKQEIVERFGLTPTDLLHFSGEFTAWDTEVAGALCSAVARFWEETPAAFLRRVRERITQDIVKEVIQFLSGTMVAADANNFRKKDLGRWIFNESIKPEDPFLGSSVHLKVPIIGIGAPAAVFLPAVAKALGTALILPPHYEVGNAIGAVAGSVVSQQQAEVFPWIVGALVRGYFARVDGAQTKFKEFPAALAFARQRIGEIARNEAIAAGASEPVVHLDEKTIARGMVKLTAWAAGKPEI